ncbi:alcohol dehydrogenase [Balamuthia mandrillaris]
MATSMKAWAQTEWGTGEGKLKVAEVERPAAGPRDLIVKINAVATNPVDYKRQENFGNKDGKPAKPLIVGWDAAGVVEEVGSEVQFYKVGDEVYFAGNVLDQGCFAEYTKIDERLVGAKPTNLSFEEAAAIPLVSLTAWEALIESAGLNIPLATPENPNPNEGKTLLITAGAGGVGSFATQLAKKLLNIRVIATASREDSAAYCKKMGADDIIDHTKDFKEELTRIGLEGVDYILNCTEPSKNMAQISNIIKPLGKICLINGDNALDVQAIFLKRVTLVFEFMSSRPLFGVETEKQRDILNQVKELLENGTLVTTANTFLKWNQLEEALALQVSGKAIGKTVLTVDWTQV